MYYVSDVSSARVSLKYILPLSKKWGFMAFFWSLFSFCIWQLLFSCFLGIPTVASKRPEISLHWYPDHQFRELDQMVKIKETHIYHHILDQGFSKPIIIIVFMLTTWMPFIRFRRIFMVGEYLIFAWLFREFDLQLR